VDKPGAIGVARDLVDRGFRIVSTRGTAATFQAAGIEAQVVNKVLEGRPHIVDMIKNNEVDMIVNTTEGRRAIADSASIRASAQTHNVFYTTTLAAAEAVCAAMKHAADGEVRRLQDLHARVTA
jgi:carbamoyl-phosphate synthase large subunit